MTALFMATAMAVAPAPAAPTHEVVSLSLIAQCELGDSGRWPELLELNGEQITDPNIIEPGWTLMLPEGASGDCPTEPVVQAVSTRSAQAVPAAEAPTPRQAPAPKTHVHSSPAQSSSTGSSSGAGLDGIKACESGGDYGAVSASGKYRGAYQFDQSTWESVGGSGDPAAASPAEQDQRAAALKSQRGSSPWPSCG
jgi:hypothetical protein